MHPSDNLATLAAAPRTVRVQGRDYRVAKLTPRGAGRMQALVMDKVPSPKAEARGLMEGLPEAVQIRIWEDACREARDWPPDIDSPAGQRVLMGPEGHALIVELALGPYCADLNAKAAADLADRLTAEELEAIMDAFVPEGRDDPKAPGATTTATATAPA